MDSNTLISFSNLAAVLAKYGEAVCEAYRKELRDRGKDASGLLSQSVRYMVNRDGTTYAVDLSLQDYWKYVEYGRRPLSRFPPLDKILEWIKVKPVVPRPMDNGKLPTEKQLAFLIGRKIAREGIKPTPALDTAVGLTYAQFIEEIGKAITADLSEAVDGVLDSLVAR